MWSSSRHHLKNFTRRSHLQGAHTHRQQFSLQQLEDRTVPALIITGTGPGGGPNVKVFDAETNSLVQNFLAYDSSFRGGVQVAVGDVTGNGEAEIVTGVGVGGGPHVKVFDAETGNTLSSFFAYDPSFNGGVHVAVGDVTGDGKAEIVTGVGVGGGPNVKVFDGETGQPLFSFFAYDSSFRGGVQVAVGDVTGDGKAEIVTGVGVGGGPHVKVFDAETGNTLSSFFAYDPSFNGGVHVAVGDVTGDGKAEIVTGVGVGGGPNVTVFDGETNEVVQNFFAYDSSFRGGVYVAVGDVTGDGKAEVVTGVGVGGGPHVKVFDGETSETLSSFFAYEPSFIGGVFVAVESFPAFEDVPSPQEVIQNVLPYFDVEGVEKGSFNPLTGQMAITFTGAEFGSSAPTVTINGAPVAESALSISPNKVNFQYQFQDGRNEVRIKTTDASGNQREGTILLWAGSNTLTVRTVDEFDEPIDGATVKLQLGDNPNVYVSKISEFGEAVFENVPDRTINFLAHTTDNLFGVTSNIGSIGTVVLRLLGFDEPSVVDNNDISQGIAGWNIGSSPVEVIDHVEEGGPARMVRNDVPNKDLQLNTSGEGTQSLSRTFKAAPGTTSVKIRYRFVTSEIPGGYFGTRYNDSFSVSIRSNVGSDFASEASTMNALGREAFDANGMTGWRELILPVEHVGDIIQVDVSVTNVADGLFDSQVIIDFIEEAKEPMNLVDYDFISNEEGGQFLEAYIPTNKSTGEVIQNSGVTIATGVDLGQRTVAQINALDIPQDLKDKLTPYAGLTKDDAVTKLEEMPFTPLTKSEADALDKVIKQEELDRIVREYDGDTTGPMFFELLAEAQTAIASIAFQKGARFKTLGATDRKYWDALTSQEWDEAARVLREEFVNFKPRRNREAALLEQIGGN